MAAIKREENERGTEIDDSNVKIKRCFIEGHL